jgi:uncharacterized protein YndB with AHSA1/START domain
MKRDLRFEAVYPYPIEKVWRAITDPKAISQWLMENDFEPKLGHKFMFRSKPQPGWDGIVNCEVLELDPPRRLSYSWSGGGLNTMVTFLLEPATKGTRLRLEHKGFAGLKGLMVSMILGSGWKSNILKRNLPAVLAYVDDTGFHPPAGGIVPGCHRS